MPRSCNFGIKYNSLVIVFFFKYRKWSTEKCRSAKYCNSSKQVLWIRICHLNNDSESMCECMCILWSVLTFPCLFLRILLRSMYVNEHDKRLIGIYRLISDLLFAFKLGRHVLDNCRKNRIDFCTNRIMGLVLKPFWNYFTTVSVGKITK